MVPLKRSGSRYSPVDHVFRLKCITVATKQMNSLLIFFMKSWSSRPRIFGPLKYFLKMRSGISDPRKRSCASYNVRRASYSYREALETIYGDFTSRRAQINLSLTSSQSTCFLTSDLSFVSMRKRYSMTCLHPCTSCDLILQCLLRS